VLHSQQRWRFYCNLRYLLLKAQRLSATRTEFVGRILAQSRKFKLELSQATDRGCWFDSCRIIVDGEILHAAARPGLATGLKGFPPFGGRAELRRDEAGMADSPGKKPEEDQPDGAIEIPLDAILDCLNSAAAPLDAATAKAIVDAVNDAAAIDAQLVETATAALTNLQSLSQPIRVVNRRVGNLQPATPSSAIGAEDISVAQAPRSIGATPAPAVAIPEVAPQNSKPAEARIAGTTDATSKRGRPTAKTSDAIIKAWIDLGEPSPLTGTDLDKIAQEVTPSQYDKDHRKKHRDRVRAAIKRHTQKLAT
jgi:hypothetical protein